MIMKDSSLISRGAEPERAILVGLVTPTQDEERSKEYLSELAFLADTAGATAVKTFTQKLDYPNPRTFVGKGKLEEIKAYIEADGDISMAIFDDDLSTKQVLNIERELGVKILDRTNLILDIFAKRAQTRAPKRRLSLRNISICCRASRECGLTWNANEAVSVCEVPERHRLRQTVE